MVRLSVQDCPYNALIYVIPLAAGDIQGQNSQHYRLIHQTNQLARLTGRFLLLAPTLRLDYY